jgi:tetratricopeptide (TPR) repeat protein
MENKNEVSAYLENISILLLGVMFFGLPLIFTTLTTDPFTLPKQVFLIAGGLVLMLLSGARMISEGSVRISKTPFDVPMAAFGAVIIISALLAVNRFDAIIATLPVVFAIILYFFIVNLAKNRAIMTFLLTAFITGVGLTALISVLSYAKIYVLPMAFTKDPNFSTLGTILDQAMYFTFALPIVGYYIYSGLAHIKTKRLSRSNNASHTSEQTSVLIANPLGMLFSIVAGAAIVLALALSLYRIATQHPVMLPYEVGFQTGFAAISQDAGRTIQAFLFGSGYGTYSVDFSRFKLASFNLNTQLWSLTFFRSSSYVLELLATTGILGVLSFLFILWRIIKEVRSSETKKAVTNPLTISVVLAGIASLVLPFAPIIIIAFFIIIALFAAEKRLLSPAHSEKYYDVELHFVTLNMGLISMMPLEGQGDHKVRQTEYTKILPVTLFILFAVISAIVGFFTYNFLSSDIIFQRSLIAAAQNNGLQTYQDQVIAIRTFPWRDAYYRIASQTDLALANSLASSVPAGSSPSAQLSQNITQLIQESIATGRAATEIAPLTAVNWQNLSGVYRGLIGFGQNAEQFAIATQQQAIALNPNDPQGYINLGGIYYQLKLWDNAQSSFQTAVQLKPDYANAYYNLGHALEQKGDYQNALTAYQTVKTLIANDKEAVKKMDEEIKAVEAKIGKAETEANAAPEQAEQAAAQEPVGVNQPETQLPAQKNPVKIPSPAVTAAPSPSTSPAPTTTQ